MLISFGNQLAEDLFYDKKSRETRRFPNELRRVARRKLLYLHEATVLSDLKVPQGNRLEALKQDMERVGARADAARLAHEALTKRLAELTEADVIVLRDAGWDDGEILEINQVCSYFSYANRTVLGLGCSTKGDVLGLSPNNSYNPDDWGHR